MPDQIRTMLDSFKSFWDQLLQFLPQLLFGIVILIVGWLLAKLIRLVLIKFLKFIRLDSIAEKAGIEDFLLKGGVQYSSVIIVANIIYWIMMLILTLAVLESLGLGAADDLFNRMLQYIPNIIIGTLFAKFMRSTIFTYLSNIGMSGAVFISNTAQWAILFLVIFVALQQLSLGGQILVSAFEIAFGGLCLALAIAFGLAGKEWATQILEKLWRKSR
jgi:hypothetical protein